jgi:hypothetical protein
MKKLLIRCRYPENVIDKGIFNAKKQGPAPQKTDKDNIVAYIHPNMSNFQFNHILKSTTNLLQNAESDVIKDIFKDVRLVEAVSQPRNLLRTLSSKSTNNVTETTPGIFAECNINKCEICRFGYIENCTSFTTSSGKTWVIKSHINCNSRNVIYYLECAFCDGDVTKTGKTFFMRDRINNHRSDCHTGRTTDVFDRHCHECGAHRGQQPYFRVKAFMKLNKPDKLLTYENLFHQRRYATINT